jgi:hypothetical protein
VQLQIFAELEASISMGQRECAFDVVRDSFAGSIRYVIDRENDDVVPHADPAILTPVSQNSSLRHDLRPPLCLEIVSMDMIAGLDRLHDPANLAAVLDDRVANAEIS